VVYCFVHFCFSDHEKQKCLNRLKPIKKRCRIRNAAAENCFLRAGSRKRQAYATGAGRGGLSGDCEKARGAAGFCGLDRAKRFSFFCGVRCAVTVQHVHVLRRFFDNVIGVTF